jgi:D-sedoheptulose 7-phosphate isomerase
MMECSLLVIESVLESAPGPDSPGSPPGRLVDYPQVARLKENGMLGAQLDARTFMERVGHELLRVDVKQIDNLADQIHRCYVEGRFVFIAGNGGSGSNASHFCEDLGKSTLRREDFENDGKKRLKVLSLTDNTPYILAWGNDEGFDRVFVEQLKNLAGPGDLLIAISGSGNSPNILRAVDWANHRGLVTFGCTGYSGGKLRTLARHNLHVPLDDMGIVESIHLAIFHWVLGNLHARING